MNVEACLYLFCYKELSDIYQRKYESNLNAMGVVDGMQASMCSL